MNNLPNCKLVALLFFFFCSQFLYAQLTDFTLTVSKTDESCSGNGSLTFNSTNTSSGATIVYTIYLLPNTTNPVATQSTNTLSGLVAGTYRIVATQTLGNLSNSEQQDIAIISTIVPLTYNLTGTPGVCQNGSIIVDVKTGMAVSYEIISGPVIVPLQTSNVFNLLPPGLYQIRVFDACGEGVVKNFTLTGSSAALNISSVTFPSQILPTCDSIDIRHTLSAPSGTSIAYPLSVEITVFPPTGPSVIVTQIIATGSPNVNSVIATIPFFAGQSYTYDIVITDSCGNEYIRNGNIINRNLGMTLTTPAVGCDKSLVVTPFNFVAPYTIAFLAFPAGFNATIYNAIHPGPFFENATYYNPSIAIPDGTYIIEITDACGRIAQSQIEFVNQSPVSPPQVQIKNGCDEATGSVKISAGAGLVSVNIVVAPISLGQILPLNISTLIASDGSFYMNNLPIGTYSFEIQDSCGNLFTTNVIIAGSSFTVNTVEITQNCASFNLELNHTSNVASQNQFFWLQEFNTVTSQWGHPGTGASNNTPPSVVNAWLLSNNSINNNLAFSGIFRIVKTYEIFNNGVSAPLICVQEIFNFEFDGFPKIEALYSFSCSDDATDVIVVATGAEPLIYRITLKNGLPFAGSDQTINLFTGLDPAIYNFQVEDNCGNILNRVFDVTEPLTLSIAPLNLCGGQPGSLTLPALPFLEFQWWKGNDPTNILSTTNTLSFVAFDPVTDSGFYHVSVVYPNANSCVDLVLDFEISPTLSTPNAGSNTTNNFCGSQGIINLFDLLPEPYDNFGQWEEISTSGTLDGNLWNSANLSGTYIFKYKVEGLCDIFAESQMTINILNLPETPQAFIEQVPCDGQSLQLVATTIPEVTYSWTGPNGFTSSEQNPVIENISELSNGIYSVQVSAESCVSEISSIEIFVTDSPKFTTAVSCNDNLYLVSVIPLENSFETSDVTYAWTGPENFISSDNPVNLTGLPTGIYWVTVTSSSGCPTTESITVANTLCSIPKGVSPNADGQNDAFDLSGFEIEILKIFNRYGMVVFEQEDYTDQWHGQDNKGNGLPSATYYYLLQLENGETKSGWVYLQRQ